MKSPIDPVELTRQLVEIHSDNPFRTTTVCNDVVGIGTENEINCFIEKLLSELGFSVQRQYVVEANTTDDAGQLVPERWNLLAEKGEGEKSILLFGHTDTVDAKLGWQTNPFVTTEVKKEDGDTHLYALGANDMKSGLAAMIAAIPEQIATNHKIKLAFLVDEEYWSFGASKLLESKYLDDVVFAIVPEIGENIAAPNILQIGLGRLGRHEICFNLKGKSCHGADAFVDETSINAVHESVKLQSVILDYCEKKRRVFNTGKVSVTNSAYINMQQGGLGALSVPDEASFILDRSFVPGESAEAELVELKELVNKLISSNKIKGEVSVEFRSRPTAACAPYLIDENNELLQQLISASKKHSLTPEFFFGRSVADENRIAARGIPTVIVSPNGAGSHTPHEWVSMQSIYNLQKVLRTFLSELKI